MSTQENLKIANLQDCFTKFYYYLAKNVIDEKGVNGEKAIRAAVRAYGKDRGETQRREHLEAGLKPNLVNLFTLSDLPADPRVVENMIYSSEQECFFDEYVCPIANLWIEMGGKELGRIYCEEFHHVKYAAYAHGAQINITQTITQKGDDHCRFSVYLRPSNMTEEERKETFTEYDPGYIRPQLPAGFVKTHKAGYMMMCIKLYYHIAQATIAAFGEEGKIILGEALSELATDLAEMIVRKAKGLSVEADAIFLADNLAVDPSKGADYEALWALYADKTPQKVFETAYFEALAAGLAK